MVEWNPKITVTQEAFIGTLENGEDIEVIHMCESDSYSIPKKEPNQFIRLKTLSRRWIIKTNEKMFYDVSYNYFLNNYVIFDETGKEVTELTKSNIIKMIQEFEVKRKGETNA